MEGVSGQHIANRAALVVHPSSIYVACRGRRCSWTRRPGRPSASSPSISPAAARGVPVTVSLLREQWVADAADRWRSVGWERREIPVGEWTVRTAAGETSLPMPIRDGGSYILRAIARDAAGRPTRTEIAFYAFGRGASSWQSDGNAVDLTPERQTWKPGETARILIQSPWDRATALVTIEREGIRSHRPLRDHLHAGHRRGADHRSRCAERVRLRDAVKGRTVDRISTPTVRTTARPRSASATRRSSVDDSVEAAARGRRLGSRRSTVREQPVTVSVAVTDAANAPAPSEVTLWAVDYGLLSLTGYSTPDVLRAIYARRPLQVQSEESRTRSDSARVGAIDSEGGAGAERALGPGAAAAAAAAARSALRDVMIDGIAGRRGRWRPAGTVPPARSAPPPGPEQDEMRTDFRPLVFWLASRRRPMRWPRVRRPSRCRTR